MQAYQKYKDEGVVFIGLTPVGEDGLQQTSAYIQEFGIAWPSGYGVTKTLKDLGVRYFPTKLVVGTDGLVAWHDELGGSLDDAIRRALGNSAT